MSHAAQHKPHTFVQNIEIASLFLSFYHGSVHYPAHEWFAAAFFFRSTLHWKGNIQLERWTEYDKKKKLNYSDELISIPMLSRSAATNVGLLLLNGCPSGGQQIRLHEHVTEYTYGTSFKLKC